MDPDTPMRLSRADLLLRASRHPLAQRTQRGLHAAGVKAESPVVCCVSGGGDSMAMLVLVAALRERTSATLKGFSVLAIDHGLRADNRREAEHAIALARFLGVQRAEIRRVMLAETGNILDAARAARLQATREFAVSVGAQQVLLAHQSDDRAEGLLLALKRGAGIDAAACLVPVRAMEGGVADQLVLCRPMLAMRRSELRAFLSEMQLTWCEDPSNTLRSRGAIRGDPSLAALCEEIAAGAGAMVEETAALCALRDELLDQLVPRSQTTLTRESFESLPKAIQSEALARLVRAAGGGATRAILDAALQGTAAMERRPRTFACQGGVVLRIDAREIAALTSD